MNLTKRIISSALVLSMATLTIPVEAYATSNTIKGQVFFERWFSGCWCKNQYSLFKH